MGVKVPDGWPLIESRRKYYVNTYAVAQLDTDLAVLILEIENTLCCNSIMKTTACAYYRTSSASNVGEDKDSLKRQRDAVSVYATANSIEIVKEYYDAAVSGCDPVLARPGFVEMLTYMLSNGARTVLVETASRFARDITVQITGHDLLKSKGIALIPVDAPDHFQDDTPTAKMVRNILGVVSQFEKEALVLKLRKARDRKRRDTGRCEGNPNFGIIPIAHIKAAKALSAKGMSLRRISEQLVAKGFVSGSNNPYSASAVRSMLKKSA
jgi:DNA invertase Pin-like site-specific DNA recombinase